MRSTVNTNANAAANRRRVLAGLLLAGIAISVVHYTDNFLRFGTYVSDNPSFPGRLIKAWVIPVSWVGFTICAWLGWSRFRAGRYPQAAAWIGAYSVSGTISVAHFKDISPSDLALYQQVFVWLDVAAGVALLVFAIRLAWNPPGRRNRAAETGGVAL